MNKYPFEELSDEERWEKLSNMRLDDEIDYSDIPALDDEFWRNVAKLVLKRGAPSELISIRLEKDMLDDLKRIASQENQG